MILVVWLSEVARLEKGARIKKKLCASTKMNVLACFKNQRTLLMITQSCAQETKHAQLSVTHLLRT